MRESRIPAILGALMVALYVAVAQGFGNLYPFSRFEMYATTNTSDMSRVGVRASDGRLYEAVLFAPWQCEPEAMSALETRCPAESGFAYLDRVALDHVKAHAAPAPSGESVTLVRRTWRARPGRVEPEIADCEYARCLARRDPTARLGTVSTDVMSPSTPGR